MRLLVMLAMRAPRFIPPGSLVEVTTRTNGARLYLRPSAALNAAILGIIGRALSMYTVKLHAFVCMSNHMHMLISPRDASALSSFMRYVHGNIAKAAQRLNDIRGTVWQRRASVIPVLDDDAQLQRLRYVLAHGTKERLVASPLEWPGVTTAGALAGYGELVGHWIDRDTERRLRRSGGTPHTSEYTINYPIPLTPLPVHAHLDGQERHAQVRAMLDDIESSNAGPFLGARAVLTQDPMDAPRESRNTRAPLAHTTSAVLASRYRLLRACFIASYRTAAAQHAQRPTTVQWPLNVFLPAMHYVQPSRGAREPPLREMLAT